MGFKIGNIEIKNGVVLAPMAGVSNPAYMKLCSEMGADYAITELISAEAVVRNNKKTLDMLNGINNLNMVVAVQLFGSNADVISKAAKILTEMYDIKVIDINMGCPVPKVAIRSNSGSALLKNPELVREIVSKTVKNVKCPVTVKIRSGWDNSSINAVKIAKVIEEAGASLISVHPRTRSQGYDGVADWSIIKKVKENVNIPVIGNGDIKSVYDAVKMMEETNCDGVMIGRAALGNPYIFKQISHYLETKEILPELSKGEKIGLCLKHLEYLLEVKDEKVAVLEMRTHSSWYIKGLKGSIDIKKEIFKCKSAEELKKLLLDYKNKD